MADWQEWVTSCFMSLVFAYMLAKLISIVHSFRRENLRVEREHAERPDFVEVMEERDPGFTQVASVENLDVAQPSATIRETLGFTLSEGEHTLYNVDKLENTQTMPSEGVSSEGMDVAHEGPHIDDALVADAPPPFDGTKNAASFEEGSDKEESLLSDDEDWEGIDGSDLDKAFGKAAAFLEKLVLDPSSKISNDIKLQFYGLYKQATEGPCSSPQPSAYRLSARAKWNAWKSLRDVSPEEGMQRYITLLSELYPDWNQDEKLAGSSHGLSTGSSEKAPRMGPVFSTMLSDAIEHEGLEDIHKCAKEGDLKGLETLLQSNTSVDQKDGDNRTALHWAADQGHLDIVKLLISRGAEINAKDSDGQTALHYATTCEWDEIAAFLLEKGADPSLVDNDGCTPYEHSFSPCKENSTGQDIK